jgi:hypothetical protein
MLTQQEKEVLLKVISEYRIHPLAVDAIPLLTVLQSAAKKVFEAQEKPEVLHKKEK